MGPCSCQGAVVCSDATTGHGTATVAAALQSSDGHREPDPALPGFAVFVDFGVSDAASAF